MIPSHHKSRSVTVGRWRLGRGRGLGLRYLSQSILRLPGGHPLCSIFRDAINFTHKEGVDNEVPVQRLVEGV